MRRKMRAFLVYYSKCASLAVAAERTGVSEWLPYLWKRRTDRTGRWFNAKLAMAEQVGVQRVRAEVFDAALVRRSEPMMLAILKAHDPWFMPRPKQVVATRLDPQ